MFVLPELCRIVLNVKCMVGLLKYLQKLVPVCYLLCYIAMI